MGLADKFGDDLDRITEGGKERLKKAAVVVQKQLQKELGDRGAPGVPSHPGEPPARQSGRLYNSVVVTATGNEATVACTAPYASLLERGTRKMSPRPYFRVAIQATAARVRALIFGTGK